MQAKRKARVSTTGSIVVCVGGALQRTANQHARVCVASRLQPALQILRSEPHNLCDSLGLHAHHPHLIRTAKVRHERNHDFDATSG